MNTLMQENLLDIFEYKDGELYFKKRLGSRTKMNEPSGNIYNTGYKRVHLLGKKYYIHRLIWLYHNGYMPEFIDHIDGNKLNNKIENLRACSKSQNGFNQKPRKNNTSGVKNLYWSSHFKKWLVKLQINNVVKHIGYFVDKELAELVAIEAMDKFHGNFAYKGI